MGDVSLAGSSGRAACCGDNLPHCAAQHRMQCTVNAALVNACIGSYMHIFLGELYTVSQNKFPTFKLSVTLSTLNRFSKFLHC